MCITECEAQLAQSITELTDSIMQKDISKEI